MDPMQVSGLANIFAAFGNDPAARFLVAAAALRALWSIVVWRRCPLIDETAPAIRHRIDARGRKARFAVLVLAGIGLAVWGLLALSRNGVDTPLALVALVGGIYLFTTEPVRLALVAEEQRVRDAQPGPERGLAAAMLQGAHVKLIAIEIGILVLLGLAMTVA